MFYERYTSKSVQTDHLLKMLKTKWKSKQTKQTNNKQTNTQLIELKKNLEVGNINEREFGVNIISFFT